MAEADRGRNLGFPNFKVIAGGPGSLAKRSAAKSLCDVFAMGELNFLAILIALAPLIAAQAHPIPFLVLLVGAAALGYSLSRRMSHATKWFLGILVFLVALWAGSILIIFVLKLPGMGPH